MYELFKDNSTMVPTFNHGFDKCRLKDHFHFLYVDQVMFVLIPVITNLLGWIDTMLGAGFNRVFSAAGSQFMMGRVTSAGDYSEQLIVSAIFTERLYRLSSTSKSSRIPIPESGRSIWQPWVPPCPPTKSVPVTSYWNAKKLTKQLNTTASQLRRDSTVGSSGIETNVGTVWKIMRVIEVLIGFSRSIKSPSVYSTSLCCWSTNALIV